MEYNSYTNNNSIWNPENNYNYTIEDGRNTFAPSAFTYVQEYVQQEHIQDFYKQYIQDWNFEKGISNENVGTIITDNTNDKLVEILKMILEEFKINRRNSGTMSIEEKINLIEEALEMAENRNVWYDFKSKIVIKEDKKPSYLDDDLFEI